MKLYIMGLSHNPTIVASVGDWIELQPGMADRDDIDLSMFTVTRMMVTYDGGLKIYVLPKEAAGGNQTEGT